jgi:hypothetical protein
MPTFQTSAVEFFHKVPTTRISGWHDPRAFFVLDFSNNHISGAH